jgi:molybdopterin molybdotransferase
MTAAVPKTLTGASVDEVLTLLRQICLPLEPMRVPLAEALGRTLREPVCAPEDQPAFDRSAVDGYAVRLDDRARQFQILDEIRAGDWKPRPLQLGETVRIATGGALPSDGLQVVMREDAERSGETVVIKERDSERHIRFRGEDARAGQVLAEAGTLLQPGTLGLLASVGYAEPLVTRQPRVLHAATGNEIVPPEQTPGSGQIRDSNSTLVRGFLDHWRIDPTQFHVPEDEAAARAALSVPIATADLVLISGGASVGEHDFTRRLLEHFGFTILVSKTSSRPGKPLIVAQRGATVAFGLPGNPLAHFVCLNLFVRTALRAWTGLLPAAAPIFQTGVLGAPLVSEGSSRETIWPVRWELQSGVVRLLPLRWNSSGDLTSLATANALIRVAAGVEELRAGHRVEYVGTEVSL